MADDVGGIPRSLAVDGHTLWVAVASEPTPSTVAVSGVHPFRASTCERVLAKGDSDLLIVSDLPLQAGSRVDPTQMTQAITYVLRQHGFGGSNAIGSVEGGVVERVARPSRRLVAAGR